MGWRGIQLGRSRGVRRCVVELREHPAAGPRANRCYRTAGKDPLPLGTGPCEAAHRDLKSGDTDGCDRAVLP